MSETVTTPPEKPSFEINDAKDEANALNTQPKVEETKEGDKKPDDAKPTNDSDPKEAVTEKKKKPRAQQRIEKLASEKRNMQKEIDALKAEKEGDSFKPVVADDLNPDDYDNYDDYLDALDEKDKTSKKEDETKKSAPEKDSDFQKVLDDIDNKFDETRDKYEDFDALVAKPIADGGPAISQTMLETMNEFENAGEIAYALAKDVTNSVRIANLKPMKQILEIDKLSAKLSKETEKPDGKKVEKKVTNAPEPINILGGGDAPSNSLADATNYSDYQKLRKSQNSSRNGW